MRAVSLLRAVAGVSSVAALAYLAGHRAGYVTARPPVLAACFVAVEVLLVVLAVAATVSALRGRRVAAAAEAITAAGLAAAIGAGLGNWALGIQGAVLLLERTPALLASPDALAELELGPLADRSELQVTLGLAGLRLEGAGPGAFRAVSRLKLLPTSGEETAVVIAPGRSARAGSLVLHQGLFGFAPRIVITKSGTTLLDTHVPFRTVRAGQDGVAFVEDFELAAERLLFHGAVTLEDLNDDMKGHPRLALTVEREGSRLGGGTLRPGEFVELDGGVRVGFAGLQRWSEVMFSRRNYGAVALLGAVLAALGVATWALAAWRRW